MVDFRVEGKATLDPDKIIEDAEAIIAKLDELKDKADELDLKLDEISHKGISVDVNINGEDRLILLRDLLDEMDSRDHHLTVIIDIHGYDELLILRDTVDAMDGKSHTLDIRVNIDGKDDLDSLRYDLTEMSSREHEVDIVVNVNGIDEAMAKLVALDVELKNKQKDLGDLGKSLDDTSKKVDNASKSTDKFKFSILSLLPLMTAIIPVLFSAGAGIIALAGAATMMGIAFLGVLAAAKPAFTAIQNLSSSLDQNTQNAIANAKSYDQIYSILNKNSSVFRGMSGDLQALTVGWFQLKNAYSTFQKAVDPAVFPMLEQGLELLRMLLSGLPAIVNPAASAIQGFLLDFETRLKDPVFQTFFNQMRTNIGTLVTDWLTGILNIIEGLLALFNAFMPITMQMSGGFLAMTNSFKKWAESLSTSKGFQQFVEYVKKEGPIVLHVLGQLVILIARISGALMGMGGGALGVIDRVVTGLNHLASTNPGLFKVAVNLGIVGVAISKLGPMLGPLMAFLSTPEGAIVGVIVALGIAFVYAYTHSKEFHDWVQKNLAPMFHGLVQKAQEFVNFFKSMWPDIQQVWQRYGKSIEGIVKDFVSAIVGAIEGLMKILEGIFEVLDGILTGKWSKIWDGLKKIVEGAWKVIYSIFDNAAKIILQVVEDLGKVIWNLITDAFKSVAKWVSQWWDDFVRGARSAVANIIDAVSHFGSSLLAGLLSSFGPVTSWLQALPGNIVSWLGNLGQLLWNAGWNIIKGLVDGIKNAAESILKDVLSWVTSLIPSWKGPPSKDKMLLHSSGQLVIMGFVDGLESKYGAVRNSLGNFTKSIESQFGAKFSKDIGATVSATLANGNFAVSASGSSVPRGVAGNTSSVTFAPGSIQISNAVPETAGTTLTRTMQSLAKFGSIQNPVGARVGPVEV